MDNHHEVFRLADRHFHESPDRLSATTGDEAAAPGDGKAPGAAAVPFVPGPRPVHPRDSTYAGPGGPVPAVEGREGRLAPDDQCPASHVPGRATLPEFPAPQSAARNAATVADPPYRIGQAPYFSDGGGVHAGTVTRTGDAVVLKKGRPHAGPASAGADAVTRRRRERDAAAVADLTRRPLRIRAGVQDAVAEVHACGPVFNDPHAFDTMGGPGDETVPLPDVEAAARSTDNGRRAVGDPGSVARPDRRGTEEDIHPLARPRPALFLPVTRLFAVDRGKAAHPAEVLGRRFPVPARFPEEAVAEITRAPQGADGPPHAAAWGGSGGGTGLRASSPPPDLHVQAGDPDPAAGTGGPGPSPAAAPAPARTAGLPARPRRRGRRTAAGSPAAVPPPARALNRGPHEPVRTATRAVHHPPNSSAATERST
ncbi:putative membrane translocator [Actinacidiphila reveromycinica]|uniref:Putative membrane translocator n=1 Tax=Actinacidiphila reveromycinica TaxID=659352 RepID=A0A7U3UR74_9ACTN|nr:hypothetical protein [Streptomyces sp. SN-593]BBA97161.1 putative membrane translocator [Streptomyces sp. SN-593]